MMAHHSKTSKSQKKKILPKWQEVKHVILKGTKKQTVEGCFLCVRFLFKEKQLIELKKKQQQQSIVRPCEAS